MLKLKIKLNAIKKKIVGINMNEYGAFLVSGEGGELIIINIY
ncbi:hypothetical protein HNP68_001042 [Borrelia yangtzensis]|uniref:Uncharacterized protein n=1 Tax=Borreliella yangtzensis TaxID=683292 RepID=A0ABR6PCW9_9SPIR|nr:hypothetical protein [Borreliella yangtzensis]